MFKSWRVLCVFLMGIALQSAGAAEDKAVDVAFELSLKADDYYVYKGDFTATFGTKTKNANGVFDRELAVRGGDIGEKAADASLIQTPSPERMAVMALLRIPAGTYKSGRKQTMNVAWRRDIAAKLEYQFTGRQSWQNIEFQGITGSVAFTKHPMLTAATSVEFTAYWNPATQWIERLVFKSQGAMNAVPLWFQMDFGLQAKSYPYTASADTVMIHVPANEGMPMAYTDDAVEMGVRHLFDLQNEKNGAWHNSWAVTALSMTALIKSGALPSDPRLKLGLQFVLSSYERNDSADLYTPNIYANCLLALYAFTNQEWLEKNLPAADLDKVKAMVKRAGGILETAFKPNIGWEDLSRSQYATLGLYSAFLTGYYTPQASLLKTNLKFHLDMQVKAGPDVELVVKVREPENAEPGEAPKNETPGSVVKTRSSRPTETKTPAKARGWGYLLKETATGSMTCGAIGSVCFLKEILSQMKELSDDETAAVAVSLRDGRAWLQANYDIRFNPGKDWFYMYYMYALERACTMGDFDYLGDHDWYEEGAMQLMKEQTAAGKFTRTDSLTPEEAASSFGLLFFKRGSLTLKKAKKYVTSGAGSE